MKNCKVENLSNHFAVVGLDCLEDNRLTGLAKALHLYGRSRPDTWELRINDICNHFKECESTIRKALRELETCGYLRREKYVNTATRQYSQVRYIWYDVAVSEDQRTNTTTW